jgi:hypothetical protein
MTSNIDDVGNVTVDDEGQELVDNDEDDEDFIPDDAEDEDGDSDDDFDDNVSLLHGIVSLDEQQRLCFEGNGFRLKSSSPLAWNFLETSLKPPRNSLTFTMDGACDIPAAYSDLIIENRSSMRKPTYRKFQVTASIDEFSRNIGASIANDNLAVNLKVDDDEEDINESKTSFTYRFVGYQLLPEPKQGANLLEFDGFFRPEDSKSNTVGLECHFRSIPFCTGFAAGANASSLPVTTGAESAEKPDYDLDEDAAIDYDELIALHEDASSTVDAVRKRYRNGHLSAAEERPVKRGKSASDNEDDDIGF